MRFINFLIKPASSACNLRCRYCFYRDEANNRSVKNMGLMQPTTVDLLLSQAYDLVEPGGMISFLFQGGEPTLAGLDWFRTFVLKARAGKPARVDVSFSIQTNGMLLDEDWAVFLKREDFLVGLSVDGMKDLHNLYRKDANGNDTWNPVCRALRLLQRHNVKVNALCVVTAQCARKPEKVYTGLKKLGFTYMQFIPCLDPIGEARGQLPFSLSAEMYGVFLCRIFDLWYADWATKRYRSVRLFEDYINLLLGENIVTCATCGVCGSYFVVEGDGSVYPCDFYVLDDWRMGWLGEQTLPEIANSKSAITFLQQGREKPAECAACQWRNLCNGGCKHDWAQHEGTVCNSLCPALRRFFAHAMPRLQQITRTEAQARTQWYDDLHRAGGHDH